MRATPRPVWRKTLLGLSTLYFAFLWLDSVVPEAGAHVPQPALYFTQAAALFTTAAVLSIDYRAEVWLCDSQEWAELDTRPYFAINRDNKENRFYRVMHFYKQQRETMRALESYLLESHATGADDDGIPRDARVGGLRFLSVRQDLPPPGAPALRWQRRPIAEYPLKDRHFWYWTPTSARRERCAGRTPARAGNE